MYTFYRTKFGCYCGIAYLELNMWQISFVDYSTVVTPDGSKQHERESCLVLLTV